MARPTHRRTIRRGLTLIELLVVLAILTAMVALVPSVVRSSRDSAHRAQCINNMKLLARGAQQYAVHLGVYPWGEGPANFNDWGAIALSLPYLDQAALHNQINFMYGGAEPSGARLPDPFIWNSPRVPINTTVFGTTLAFALCPSDDRHDLTRPQYGHINYTACSGAFPLGRDHTDGMFSRIDGAADPITANAPVVGVGPPVGHLVTPAMITDGLSYTAAWSERVKGIGYNEDDTVDFLYPSTTIWRIPTEGLELGKNESMTTVEQVYRSCLASNTVYNSSPPEQSPLPPGAVAYAMGPSGAVAYRVRQPGGTTVTMLRPAMNANPYPPRHAHPGLFWWRGKQNSGRYTHTMPPNSKLCTAGNENYAPMAYPASSRHPGGVNVAFADGTVRLVRETIAMPTWWALGSCAGGEELTQPSQERIKR